MRAWGGGQTSRAPPRGFQGSKPITPFRRVVLKLSYYLWSWEIKNTSTPITCDNHRSQSSTVCVRHRGQTRGLPRKARARPSQPRTRAHGTRQTPQHWPGRGGGRPPIPAPAQHRGLENKPNDPLWPAELRRENPQGAATPSRPVQSNCVTWFPQVLSGSTEPNVQFQNSELE